MRDGVVKLADAVVATADQRENLAGCGLSAMSATCGEVTGGGASRI